MLNENEMVQTSHDSDEEVSEMIPGDVDHMRDMAG